MDNIDDSRFSENKDLDKPTFFGDSDQMKVSHAPLNLGGDSPAKATESPVPKPAPSTGSGQAVEKPTVDKAPASRITGVKTFFTKLHPGAMEFLDEQIEKWLQKNPGINIKLTNTTTGEVQAKKTEPNIIIHVWY
jgi:ABC-type glycerol-3-phosphate transport system substrate-binding protein